MFDFIYKSLSKPISELIIVIAKYFGDEVSQIINNEIIEYQIREYERNSKTKTVVSKLEEVLLKDYYQPLSIVNSSYNILGVDDKKKSIKSTKEIFEKEKNIVIRGNIGSGKSTLIKYLFTNLIENQSQEIPIIIELRCLSDYKGNLTDYIKERVFKLNGIAENTRIIERLLKSGKFIFFLDGYDEITSNSTSRITKDIDNLVKIYSKNKYLITSRYHTYIEMLPTFINYEICKLTKNEIYSFIERQYPNNQNYVIRIIKSIDSVKSYSLLSFLSNPLLLSLYINNFHHFSNIPEKRSQFYDEIFNSFFFRHDYTTKKAFKREIKSGLSIYLFSDILQHIGYKTFLESQIYFSEKYSFKIFDIISKKEKMEFDYAYLINDLVRIGVLLKENTNTFSFLHPTIQEYFAAKYISNIESQKNKKNVYDKLTKDLINNKEYTSRVHFYEILLELDESNLIKYLLIPFFNNILNTLSLINHIKAEENIRIFNMLLTVYGTFEKIINNKVIREFKSGLLIQSEQFNNNNKTYANDKDYSFILKEMKTDIRNQIAVLSRKIKINDEYDYFFINNVE